MSTSTISVVTSVADTASSVNLVPADENRKGVSIYNDSTVGLYIKCGTTASATSFTYLAVAAALWEAPYGYTGVIDGIWASDASGSARITEFF